MRRKYRVDDRFFDRIDTQEKAYFLGLLCADGCNHEAKGCVSLKLQRRDRGLVYALRRAVRGTGPVRVVQPISQFPNAQPQYAYQFTSHRISERLAALGCTSRKSLTLAFPSIPPRMIRHFVRGYFDGDGHVGVWRNRCPVVQIVSSRAFCDSLRDCLAKSGIASVVKPMKTIFALFVHRKQAVATMFRHLYSRATIQLPRKRRKFEEARERALWVKPVMTPEQRSARGAEKAQQYRLRHPEKVKGSNRAYRLKHRAERIAFCRDYRRLHPDKYAAYEASRAQRMRTDPAYRAARNASRMRQYHARQAAMTA